MLHICTCLFFYFYCQIFCYKNILDIQLRNRLIGMFFIRYDTIFACKDTNNFWYMQIRVQIFRKFQINFFSIIILVRNFSWKNRHFPKKNDSSKASVTSVTNVTHSRVKNHQLCFFQPLLPTFSHYTPYFSVFYMSFFYVFKW